MKYHRSKFLVFALDAPLRFPLLTVSSAMLVALCLSVASTVSAQGPGGAPVVVAAVIDREVSAGQTFVGTIVPLKRSVIGSAVDGRVVEFPINQGDRVTAGQPLTQLLTKTLSLELAAAEAQLRLYEEELTELRNGSRPEEIEQARARKAGSEALLEFTKSRYDRMRRLLEQGRAVTQEQVEESLSSFVQAEQSSLEAKAAYELAVQGPRPEKIAQAEAKVEAQRETANRIADQIKKHTIRSPFDGYVVAEHTEVGEWVNRGDLVAEVVALDQVDVEAHILEKHISHVRIGMPVRVEVPAIPEQAFTGQVALIVPQADVRARTFPVKVRVENPMVDEVPMLKSGMLARITLPTGPTELATLVPKDALVLGGQKPLLYVADGIKKVGDQGKVRPVPVDLGVADGALIQVKGNLKPGELIVVQGNERLRPEQEVTASQILDLQAESADLVGSVDD